MKMGKPSLNQRNPFLPGRPRRQSLGQRVKCSIFQGCSCREQRSRPRNQTGRKKSWLETAVWRQQLGVSTAECRRPSLGQSRKQLNNWTSEQPPAPASWAEDRSKESLMAVPPAGACVCPCPFFIPLSWHFTFFLLFSVRLLLKPSLPKTEFLC